MTHYRRNHCSQCADYGTNHSTVHTVTGSRRWSTMNVGLDVREVKPPFWRCRFLVNGLPISYHLPDPIHHRPVAKISANSCGGTTSSCSYVQSFGFLSARQRRNGAVGRAPSPAM